MPTQNGSSPFNDLIQNFMLLSQIKNQNEQMDIQRKRMAVDQLVTQINGLRSFIDLSRSTTDPTKLSGLRDAFSQASEQLGGLFKNDVLEQIQAALVPTTEVLTSGAVERGAGKFTPTERDTVDRNAASVTFTGQTMPALGTATMINNILSSDTPEARAGILKMVTGLTPGQFQADTVLASRPAEWFQNAQNIESGQALSAAQVAQRELGYANITSSENIAEMQKSSAQIIAAAQQGLQMAGLVIDQKKLASQINSAANNPNVSALLEQYGQAVRSLSDTKLSNSEPELASKTQLVNTLAQQLVEAGALPPAFWEIPPEKRFMMGGKTYLRSDEVNPSQYGQLRSEGFRPIAPTITPKDVAKKTFLDYLQR